jgi:hypothetical protein
MALRVSSAAIGRRRSTCDQPRIAFSGVRRKKAEAQAEADKRTRTLFATRWTRGGSVQRKLRYGKVLDVLALALAPASAFDTNTGVSRRVFRHD